MGKEPLEVLKEFINEMYQWNMMCQEIDKIPKEYYNQKNMILEKLNGIFLNYLTVKDRKYTQQLSYSNPPEYNLATNEILTCNVENKKAYIEIQETVGFKNKIKYTLHLKNDGWRIDKKEWWDEFDNKWKKGIL